MMMALPQLKRITAAKPKMEIIMSTYSLSTRTCMAEQKKAANI